MKCEICRREISESIGECVYCNSGIRGIRGIRGIPNKKEGIPE